MAASSDELVKQEFIDLVGIVVNNKLLRVFPESSNDDQLLFVDGGLTFGIENAHYGSCDACWYIEDEAWTDPLTGKTVNDKPIVVVEGTDALNRGSSGNAQYQRFHHALGAVKSGLIGIYYLRPGSHEVQVDLYEMAYKASYTEEGTYIVTTDLNDIKTILEIYDDKPKLQAFLDAKLQEMHDKFMKKFKVCYNEDWNNFAKKRSTVLKDNYIIKYAGRNKRNFTDGSQRAGHIATGEMFLTKYFFPEKHFFYVFLKTFQDEIIELDRTKATDKEWQLLRNEPNVTIVTLDDFINVPEEIYEALYSIKDMPLKGEALKTFNKCKKELHEKLDKNEITLKEEHLTKLGLI